MYLSLESIEDRFSQLQQISSIFGYLYDISSLQNESTKVIMDHCKKLEEVFQDDESKYLYPIELCNEIYFILPRISEKSTPLQVLQ